MPSPLPPAVLDACVLYSAPLRDFLMRLALHLFQPKWTDEIHEEWTRNLLAARPEINPERLARTRALMDRHVLAAAIAAHASVIVTFNLRDFPPQALAPHGVTARHPDDFAADLYSQSPEMFVALARQHRAALVNPSKTAEEYLATLGGCGLRQTAVLLRAHLAEI